MQFIWWIKETNKKDNDILKGCVMEVNKKKNCIIKNIKGHTNISEFQYIKSCQWTCISVNTG